MVWPDALCHFVGSLVRESEHSGFLLVRPGAYECQECGALTTNTELHERWHDQQQP